uniref:Annexin n=1 Tax=Arion vulgaris TaxID=1028688 RepID=A0A0B6YTW9_9EUPU
MPGTIRHRHNFDAGEVAATLRKAMAGFGTDEKAIIHCLGNHTCVQRIEAAKAYKTAFGKDLVADIKSELTGDFEEVCVAMLTPPRILDARELHDAISGAGTDETTIIEVLCTKNNTEIEEIKAVYKQEYGRELEKDLCGDTSGYFRRLMVSLMAAGRETEDWECDKERARKDAKTFFEAGEARWGTEEAELNQILCLRSRYHLLEVFHQFKEMSGKTIEESIQNECSGSLQEGFLAIVQSIKDTPGFFAQRIHKCVEGLGTSDSHLIRIIVTRSEIDMEEIEHAYKAKYGKSLADEIESECGGDYKRMLLACIKLDD